MTMDANNRSHRPAGLPQGVAGTFDTTVSGVDDADVAPPMGAGTVSNAEACVNLAKRRTIDLLWKTASIEVRGLTFPASPRIESRQKWRLLLYFQRFATVVNVYRDYENHVVF